MLFACQEQRRSGGLRSCSRGKQQQGANGWYPCSWALPTSVVTRPARCSFRPAARMDARQQAGASMAVGAAGAPLRMSEQARAVSEPEGGAMSELLLDAAGRRRSPDTLPTFHAGQSPRNKGMRYPADPPTTEEIVRLAARRRHGPRSPAARPDRRAVARRAAHPRGARARRGRPGPAARTAAGAARQGPSAPRGRHGRLGLGTA